MIKSTLV